MSEDNFYTALTLGARSKAKTYLGNIQESQRQILCEALYHYRFNNYQQSLLALDTIANHDDTYYALKALNYHHLGNIAQKQQMLGAITAWQHVTLPPWLDTNITDNTIIIDDIFFMQIHEKYTNNELEDTIQQLSDALKVAPENQEIWYYLLHILCDNGQYAKAALLASNIVHDGAYNEKMLFLLLHIYSNNPNLRENCKALLQTHYKYLQSSHYSYSYQANMVHYLLSSHVFNYNQMVDIIAGNAILPAPKKRAPSARPVNQEPQLGIIVSQSLTPSFYHYYYYLLVNQPYHYYDDGYNEPDIFLKKHAISYRNIKDVPPKTKQHIMQKDGVTHLCVMHDNIKDISDTITPLYFTANPYIQKYHHNDITHIAKPALPLYEHYANYSTNYSDNNHADKQQSTLHYALIIDHYIDDLFIETWQQIAGIVTNAHINIYVSLFADTQTKQLLDTCKTCPNIDIISLAVKQPDLWYHVKQQDDIVILLEKQLFTYDAIMQIPNGKMIIALMDSIAQKTHPLSLIYKRLHMAHLLCHNLVTLTELLLTLQQPAHKSTLYNAYFAAIAADNAPEEMAARRAIFQEKWPLL